MALSTDFKDAVDSNDITMTRIMLKDSMLYDLSLKQFEERLQYAEEHLPGLFDNHDGEAFNNDVTVWSAELLDEQTTKLMFNFSRERLDYLSKLIRHIYSNEAAKADKERFIEENKSSNASKAVGTGLVLVGGAAIAADLIASHQAAVAAALAAEAGTEFVATGLATLHPGLAITGAIAVVGGGIIIAKSMKLTAT